MDAENIVKLTPETLTELLESRTPQTIEKDGPGRRNRERWPFPGTVEVWLPEQCYGDRHLLATLHNLSLGGLAMRTRRPIPTHTVLSLAIHLPELSGYGRAVVRHCTGATVGYLVGAEFLFGASEDAA